VSSIIWNRSTSPVDEVRDRDGISVWLAFAVTAAAVLYNFALCFVNTRLHAITPGVAIATEIALIGAALALIWNRTYTLYAIVLPIAAYFYVIMIIRGQLDPKILRDVLIPIAFLILGSHLGTLRSADRLVTFLIFVALGAALFEWLALDTFVRYFDVDHYYIARGTIRLDSTEAQSSYNGFFNSTRFSGRTLLPFLGDHRVSTVFLEAPSVGNFAAIVFAWLALRPKRAWSFLVKVIAVSALIVLADARFGLYFCALIFLAYATNLRARPIMLFVAPFLAMTALLAYGSTQGYGAFGNDLLGRLFHASPILSHLDVAQVFGLQAASDVSTGVQFASDPINDSGYAYVLTKIGLLGAALLWALFVCSPVAEQPAKRFKIVIALYYVFLLSLSATAFTIKTAALLWFLYGTLSRRDQSFAPSLSPRGGRAGSVLSNHS
jgi:putative polymerase